MELCSALTIFSLLLISFSVYYFPEIYDNVLLRAFNLISSDEFLLVFYLKNSNRSTCFVRNQHDTKIHTPYHLKVYDRLTSLFSLFAHQKLSTIKLNYREKWQRCNKKKLSILENNSVYSRKDV